jgi:predicted Fe-Mo cluster-binding NifX family protein
MKIAFPTQQDQQLKSEVYGHFGSAKFFVVVDADTDSISTISNQDLNHQHGNCQPLAALGGTAVDAVVVGGIGGGALRKLNDAGIKTYRAIEGTVSDNLALAKEGKLPVFAMDQTCAGHAKGIGECLHH